MDKEEIREFGLQLGADVVGFASIADYKSPRSPDPRTILPDIKSMVVLGYRENNGAVDSENTRISMGSRMGCMDLSLKNNYLMARHIERATRTMAAPVSFSYPLDMSRGKWGSIGDVSLRHAAVAAGLGVLGRNNLVMNPEFGTRVIYTAILTALPLISDPPIEEDLCIHCDLCVKACPSGALSEEGKTDLIKCANYSQPYGLGGMLKYLKKFIGSSPETQKDLLKDPLLLSLYQAQFIGFQYICWRCMAVCPVGRRTP
jgi:epoxyqueuosine reductase QueG